MKKFILPLFAALFLLASQANAQTVNCNAGFTTTNLTATNIKFNPINILDTPTVYHNWSFGDSSPLSTFVSPSHNYSPGVFNVRHITNSYYPGTSNTPCRDTFYKQITITSCNLQASFTASPVASNPLTIIFQSTSIGAAPGDSILWTFGDGTATQSSSLNTSHTYASPGTYNACLRIVKMLPNGGGFSNCISDICHPVVIVSPTTCQVQANFNLVPTAGTTNPLAQYFANTSTNIIATDSIRWTFGDGTSANTFNASHTYANYGTYNVCLRVIKRINGILQPNCVSEVCRLDTILAPPCALQASFYPSITNTNSLTQAFINNSIGLAPTDSIRWTFGDPASGVLNTASTINATHVFSNYGIYNVCLRIIKRINGVLQPNCVSEVCHLDTIAAPVNPCNIQAYFSTGGDTTVMPNVTQFNNQSQNVLTTDSFLWNFGDGTSSTVFSPAHFYSIPGIYTICLTVTRQSTVAGTPPCVRQYCKILTVLPQPTPVCNLFANFNFVPNTTSLFTHSYVNTSINAAPTDSIRWSFGDGTTSNVYSPTHTYANTGYYNVCLRIIKRNAAGTLQTNCISELCRWDSIIAPNPCNFQAYFYDTLSSNVAPAIAYFTNQSIGILPTDIVTWTFGDGSTGTGANPVHTYSNAGTYTACIRIVRQTATGTTPCIRDYCRTFTITAPVTTCNISANYTWYRDSAVTIPNLYHFTNTTVGLSSTDSIRWSFGDGTYSSAVNPNHSYAQTGTYQVCLRVIKRNTAGILLPNCVSEKCYTVVVASPTGINCANVTLTYNTTTDPLYINRKTFTAVSNSTILSQTWTITRLPQTAGAGSVIINQFNPTYAFLDSGSYRVCLRAVFANNCIKDYCTVINIALPTPTTSLCNLNLYPNPASTVVTGRITLAQPLILYAFIYNSQNMLVAQKIQQGAVGLNNVPVNIANLPAGIYRYRLYYGFQTCVSTFFKQ